MLHVDVYGVMLGTKLAIQRMLPRGRGHVINIASVGGVKPVPGIATYCAYRRGLVAGWARTVCRDCAA